MAYKNDILLGRITKVSGYEGAVTVKLEKIFTENIPQLESVFLEIEGRPVPFFISSLEYSGADILKLWFDGYNSIDKISEFTGCRIFLTSATDANSQNEDSQNLIGYSVFAPENNLLGSISEVISNNGQMLLNILSLNKKYILIPFHEHFIVRIDKLKKIVVMDIPEGLLEIN
ncbi:MAG TPA: ribosome maturation factor RimM [Bacteroidales bacterium]